MSTSNVPLFAAESKVAFLYNQDLAERGSRN